jgi:hypothetical protein
MNAHGADFDEPERCAASDSRFAQSMEVKARSCDSLIATLHAQEKRTRPIISGTRPMGCEFV